MYKKSTSSGYKQGPGNSGSAASHADEVKRQCRDESHPQQNKMVAQDGWDASYQYPAPVLFRHTSLEERRVQSYSCSADSTSSALGQQRVASESYLTFVDAPYPRYEDEDVSVKNTFLNITVPRLPSFDEFYEERKVKSCPASGLCGAEEGEPISAAGSDMATSPDGAAAMRSKATDSGAASVARSSNSHRPEALCEMEAGTPVDAAQAGFREWPLSAPARTRPPGSWNTSSSTSGAPCAAAIVTSGEMLLPGRRVDDDYGTRDKEPEAVDSDDSTTARGLNDLMEGREHELGTPTLPTIGSAGHHLHICKPCAFADKGCGSGIYCKFCHLCEPGEKKKRKKDKVHFRREINRWRRTITGNWRVNMW